MPSSTSLVSLDNRNARAFPSKSNSIRTRWRCRCKVNRICNRIENITEPTTCEIIIYILFSFKQNKKKLYTQKPQCC